MLALLQYVLTRAQLVCYCIVFVHLITGHLPVLLTRLYPL